MNSYSFSAGIQLNLQEGPLRPYVDLYTALLKDQGYVQETAAQVMRLIADFSGWLNNKGLKAHEITEEKVDQYLLFRHRTHIHYWHESSAMERLLALLRKTGVIPADLAIISRGSFSFKPRTLRQLRSSPLRPYIDSFEAIMQSRGYVWHTIANAIRLVACFNEWLNKKRYKAQEITHKQIDQYLLFRSRTRYSQSGDSSNLKLLLVLLRQREVIQTESSQSIMNDCAFWPETLLKLQKGPLCSYVDSYRAILVDLGASQQRAAQQIRLIANFNEWLDRNGYTAQQVTEEKVDDYLLCRHGTHRPDYDSRAAIQRLIVLLRQKEVVPPQSPPVITPSESYKFSRKTLLKARQGPLCSYMDSYQTMLRKHGLSSHTIAYSIRIVADFNRWLAMKGYTIDQITYRKVDRYFLYRKRTHGIWGLDRPALEKLFTLLTQLQVISSSSPIAALGGVPIRRKTLLRLRQGPLSSYVNSYRISLREQGYGLGTTRNAIRPMADFNGWLNKNGYSAHEITHKLLYRFLRARPSHVAELTFLEHLIEHLCQIGIIPTKPAPSIVSLNGFSFNLSTRLRLQDGPLCSYIDSFIAGLRDQSYARQTSALAIRLIGDFNRWLNNKGYQAREVTWKKIDQYLLFRHRTRRPGTSEHAAMERLMGLLREKGVISARLHSVAVSARGRLLEEFDAYLTVTRSLSLSTVTNYLPVARQFLSDSFTANRIILQRLSSSDVIDFVQRQARILNPKRAQTMTTALRSFLGYLYSRGELSSDLSVSVPTVAHWSLSEIPKFIEPGDVKRVLEHCNRKTACGLRDYAVLMLLARLGLRAKEVAILRLEDIDWDAGQIVIHGKGGRLDRLPMPIDVGESIASYLEKGRPNCTSSAVFVRAKAPRRKFLQSSGVSSIARHAIWRAGIESPSQGAHLFRHSLATEMVRNGATLLEIGAILRHQRLDTTRIYAKVDTNALRSLSIPWPGTAL